MTPSQRPPKGTLRIRDPIHGTIEVTREEVALIDAPAFQRLRTIKQLGLADFAFPGATHTRYAHGLGVMHIASRMFNQLARHFELDNADRERLRETVRLAALFHDLGHAPLSHTTEHFMPPVGKLELGRWLEGPEDRLANHEDYTLKLLVDSELTDTIRRQISEGFGVEPDDIATLVRGRAPDEAGRRRFVVGGLDWMPVLRQCVSSELDADRMDYLLRDSYYAGVPYGRYDHEWLLENLSPVERDGQVFLGLDARASFSFDDFLLSRYHMFTSVYLHQIPIGYEVMLKQYFHEQSGEFVVPHQADEYLRCDDIYLWGALRRSENRWARRVTDRKAYRLLAESKKFVGPTTREEGEFDLDRVKEALDAKNIHALSHSAKGELSKYYRMQDKDAPSELDPPVYIVDGHKMTPIAKYGPLYERYAGAVHLRRLYVEPEKLGEAKAVLAAMAR